MTEAKTAAKPAEPKAKVPEDAAEGDVAAIEDRIKAKFYCPGCGKPANVEIPCEGTATAPHPPIDVVPTKELAHHGDESKLTAAPASE